MQKPPDWVFTLVFTVVMLMCRMTGYLVTPPWIDAFESNVTHHNRTYNNETSNATHEDPARQTSPYFLVLAQTVSTFVVYGFTLFVIVIFFPHQITQKDRDSPRRWFIFTGLVQSFSAILVNYSFSGTRTPTYLTAILGNFTIPIQFTLRFLILRKRPNLWQFCWASVVMVCEFICLLPTIFPGLEPQSAQHDDGGASGAIKLLWCMVFVASMIPYTAANALMERSVKDGRTQYENEDVHIIYYIFHWSLGLLIGALALFWTDLIPGFGYSENIKIFGEKMWFNLVCLFGQEGCGAEVVTMAWLSLLANVMAFLTLALLLRYSEGANYFIIAMALRSPLLLLVWTLFDEHPFVFHPHFHLSTILGIVALIFMVPAVLLYNIQPNRVPCRSEGCCSYSPADKEELLVDPQDSSYDGT